MSQYDTASARIVQKPAAVQAGMRRLFWTLIAFTLPLLGVFYGAIAFACRKDGVYAYSIPFCGLATGIMLGFLYSAIGDETKRFGPAFAAIGSALGGAGAVEIFREEGVVRKVGINLANSVGMGDHAVFVTLIFASFAIAGFLWMYFLKSLRLNPEILAVQALERDALAAAVQTTNAYRVTENLDPGNTAAAPPEVQKAADLIIKQAPTDDIPSVRERGRAFYIQKKFRDAINSFQQVLRALPDDRTALLYLGASLLEESREVEAIMPLTHLVQDNTAPIVARKLLAYALLFTPREAMNVEVYRRSAALSRQYLTIDAADVGAQINLVAALAQIAKYARDAKASDADSAKTAFLDAMTQAINLGGDAARERIRKLTENDDDLVPWRDDVLPMLDAKP